MPASAKQSAAKSSAKTTGNKLGAVTHPTWVAMITECITSHPEEARNGVSRPTIKKFVESKYNIEVTATTASQLNRAITSGAEKGIFVLPKGPSGKVKLAPKNHTAEASKENATPVVKKPTSTAKKPAGIKKPNAPSVTKKTSPPVKKAATAKAPATKKTAAVKKSEPLAVKPKAANTTTTTKSGRVAGTVTKTYGTGARKSVPAGKPAPKPAASSAKKAPAPSAKKSTVSSTKKAAVTKKPSENGKKTTVAKKTPAKKSAPAEKKAAAKPKAKESAKPAAKGTRTSKRSKAA
ncbi:hypothetical protein HDZ31DRAFT_60617 [Schizophyllum fasciatum]